METLNEILRHLRFIYIIFSINNFSKEWGAKVIERDMDAVTWTNYSVIEFTFNFFIKSSSFTLKLTLNIEFRSLKRG